jgi:mannose-1-phosphate guanylyltransferase/phosphomannomutase
MKAMILAAGEGTRLWPLTERLPKPVLPLMNRPLLSHTLSLLRQFGVREVVVNLHHCAHRTVATLGDGSAWGVSLAYSREDQLLGTAGAVKWAKRHFDSPFLVIYGDNLLDVDLGALIRRHELSRTACTIGLFRAPDPTAAGLAETDPEGRVKRFVEKPSPEQVTTDQANAGVYVLDPELVKQIPSGRPVDFGRDLFPLWLESGIPIHAWPLDGLIQDIGTAAGYLAAHRASLEGLAPRLEAAWKDGLQQLAPGVWTAPNVRVDPAAELIGPVLLGSGCIVGPEARIGPEAVLGVECSVGPGARVQRSVLWSHSRVEAEATLEGTVVGGRAAIGEGASILSGTLVGEDARVTAGETPPSGARISAIRQCKDGS